LTFYEIYYKKKFFTLYSKVCAHEVCIKKPCFNFQGEKRGLIELAIKACKKHNKKIGICGQGPSNKIHFAKWLIDAGIDSLGLIPESVIKTILELKKLA
jgi:hypothetical protein